MVVGVVFRGSVYVAVQFAVALSLAGMLTGSAWGQASGSLGNGLGAAAVGRGGTTTAERGGSLDAMQGNAAGLAGIDGRVLDGSAVAVFAQGSFRNAANANGRLSGLAGALPYGAFAMPLGSHWVGAVAFTPEIALRANWRYIDGVGTGGATYGLQQQETQIVAVRGSAGLARTVGAHWSLGATAGLVYNANDLHAPYIFQEQAQLAGLKVLVALKTHGFGVNGSGGVQWQPNTRVIVGAAWKSGTSLHTHGDVTGTASAQFTALGITADPLFRYSAAVENHLPQAASAGISWQMKRWLTWKGQADFTGWGKAFQKLAVKLTSGTNATINGIVGGTTVVDAVPLHWRNQTGVHVGVESPLGEGVTMRAGYGWMSNPVPSETALPLTAAIMQHTVALGGGWGRGRWRLDGAYQVQLPSTETVGVSSILGGEYDNSRLRLMLQSVTGEWAGEFLEARG